MVIETIRAKLLGFGVEKDEALAAAQLKAIARQAPILFVTLCVNSIAVAYTHYGVAPAWLGIMPAFLLTVICIWRTVSWLKLARNTLEGQAAVRRVRATNISAGAIGLAFACWGVALSLYGDLGTRMHVLYFLTISIVVCVHCVAQLRSASTILAIIAVPLIVYFSALGEPLVKISTLSYAASFCAMLVMQKLNFRHFQNMVMVTEENRKLAHTDALTNLPNRRSFFARLREAIDGAAATGRSVTVGIIDLDGFKPVNDSFGHHVGDEVLCEVANRLDNIMEGIGSAARLGGDEFGLIIEGERDLDMLGRAICASLQMPYALRDNTAQIGASVGFAKYPSAATTSEMLIERADYALYFAKSCHRGTAVCFAPEHEERLRSHAIIEQALRSADLESEFHLVFQPIIDVIESRVHAYEALARWNCPTLGAVPPSDFIVVAERSGLITDLTQVLLRKALAAMAAWPESVRLSFNLSAQDIASAADLFRITELMIDSGVDPSRIIFEVTETGLMHNLDDAQHSLNELKVLGVRIALDDFGTGYSSLSYVHRLPIDKLKIDRSFVRNIADDQASLKVIRALIDLSRNLGYSCVVEGVETFDQMMLLRSCGCRHMQGYLFKKPMPESEIASFHRQPLAIEAGPTEIVPSSPRVANAA